MARRSRVAFALAVVALAAAAGATRAADDTIGATVQSRVYLAESRTLAVHNQSTLAVRFTVEPAAGLTADPASLILAPDELGAFILAGDVGAEPAHLTVRVDQLTTDPGADTTALAFPVTVAAARPSEPLPWAALLLILALTATVGGTALRRRRRTR